LTKAKIKKALKEFGKDFTEEDIENIIKALDANKNGAIEYHEFIQGVCDKTSLFNDSNLKNIFRIIDHDNKGYISSEDIKKFIFPTKTFNEEAIAAYLNQFGMKINDKIFFDDFRDIILNNCSLKEKLKNKNSLEININNDEQIFCFDDSIHYTEENNSSNLSD
jgi:calcium-dependent protein kinase